MLRGCFTLICDVLWFVCHTAARGYREVGLATEERKLKGPFHGICSVESVMVPTASIYAKVLPGAEWPCVGGVLL